MPWISCKVELSLEWYENCIFSSAETVATFAITDTKLSVPVVTLKTIDIRIINTKLSELLSKSFERSVCWNKYKAILTNYAADIYIREWLDASFQGVNKLFVLPYARGDNVTDENSYRKCFLPKLKIKNYNIEIDGRNVYDQSINDSISQYDEIRKISIGQGDDYTTGCLLGFAYFEKNYRLIAADLNKQKALDADSRVIQRIIFTGKIKATVGNTRILIFYILEKSKETILEFSIRVL